MKLVIRFSARDELKALPILLRHSPGMGLPDRTYVVEAEAARALADAGIHYTEVSRDAITPPHLEGAKSGERI
jgi:hypothetical protein